MRSLEARFRRCQKKHQEVGDFVNLGRAVKDQKFSEQTIRRFFNKLIEKDDYSSGDKQQLIKHLIGLTTPEDDKNKG